MITNTYLEATRIGLDKISYSDTAVSEVDVQMIKVQYILFATRTCFHIEKLIDTSFSAIFNQIQLKPHGAVIY